MNEPNWKNKTIWTCDNLPVMRRMNSKSVDLIYADPPFNSNTNYAAPAGSRAAGAEFKDTWSLADLDAEWLDVIREEYRGKHSREHPPLFRTIMASTTDSDKSYLVYTAIRLLEAKRILKDTGSIYLHCDPTMSHYLKVVMDAIFGRGNFRNEIVWERARDKGKTNQYGYRKFGSSSDSILFYSGGRQYPFNMEAVMERRTEQEIRLRFPYEDEKGRYAHKSAFRSPGLGPRPNLCYEYKGVSPPNISGWTVSEDRLRELDESGELVWTGKTVRRKWRPPAGKPLNNVWVDIPAPSGDEYTGFRTQKPERLLRRIILASTRDENSVVFDPFAGCATTLAVADSLNRKWVGIDLSPRTASLVRQRILDRQGAWREIVPRTDLPQRTDLGDIPGPEACRDSLYGVQGGHCEGCGNRNRKRDLEVDHIVSISKGGTDHIDNLQLLCGNCTRIKGNRGMDYLGQVLKVTVKIQ